MTLPQVAAAARAAQEAEVDPEPPPPALAAASHPPPPESSPGIQGPLVAVPPQPIVAKGVPVHMPEPMADEPPTRALALVAGLAVFAGVAALLTISVGAATLFAKQLDDDTQVATETPVVIVGPEPVVDTGEAGIPDLEIRERRDRRVVRENTTETRQNVVETPEEPVAPVVPVTPSVAADQLQIVIPANVRATKIEAVCPSGYRDRAPFQNNVATLSGVPNEECRVTFKGGVVSSRVLATPGNRYQCRMLGTSAVACKPT